MILGLDTGLGTCGWALLDESRCDDEQKQHAIDAASGRAPLRVCTREEARPRVQDVQTATTNPNPRPGNVEARMSESKKKKKTTSPTQRSLAECRKRGWIAQVVERWNQYANIRQDLFGVIDIVAITPNGILGIQATTNDHVADRMAKAKAEPRLRAWLRAGARFEVWGWAKQGSRGERKRWTLRADEAYLPAREESASRCPDPMRPTRRRSGA